MDEKQNQNDKRKDSHKYRLGIMIIILTGFIAQFSLLDTSDFKQVCVVGIPYILSLIVYGLKYFEDAMYREMPLFILGTTLYILITLL